MTKVGIYNRYVLPKLVHFACQIEPITRQREKIVPLARGRVLEIGVGSGLNFPYYNRAQVSHLWALDPSDELRARAAKMAERLELDVEFIGLPGEEIPLETASVDSIVMTYTLCSIEDPAKALHGMHRVLKPGGQLLFSEHGAASEPRVLKWQNRLTPIWKKFSGGCHLNRRIDALLANAGFDISNIERAYIPGWRPGSFNYFGAATPR